MNTIYINVINGYELNLNGKIGSYAVQRLASHHLKTDPDVIYCISSQIYSIAELISRFESFGTIINSIEAHIKGTVLQPDRTITDPIGDHEYSFNDVIPMSLDIAKAVKNAEINLNSSVLMKGARDNDISRNYSDEVDGITSAGRVLRDSVNACTDYQSIIDITDTRT